MDIRNKSVVMAITLISALSIAGCGKTEDKSSEPAAAPEVKAAAPEVKTTAAEVKTTVGTDIDDTTITAKVKSAFLADADVKSFDVKVETRKGEVQLSGFVDNQSQIDRAITVARGVEGVKNVDNKMSLKTTDTTLGRKIDDGIITAKVKVELLAEPGLASAEISTVTRDGVVQLSGFATNEAQVDLAAAVARRVDGVKRVANELSTKEAFHARNAAEKLRKMGVY